MLANYAVLYYKGDYEQSLGLIEKFESSDNLEAMIYKCLIYLKNQDYDLADKFTLNVFEMCIQRNDKIHELGARYARSRVLAWKGEFHAGLELLNITDPYFEYYSNDQHKRENVLQWMSYVIYGQGQIHWRLNNISKALEVFYKGLKIVQEINFQPLIADYHNNIGIMYNIKGELSKAYENYEIALNINTTIGNLDRIFFIRNNISVLTIKKGDLDQALKYLLTNLHYLQQLKRGTKSMWRVTLANLGKIYHIQNKYEKAIEHYIKASENAESIEDLPALSYDLFKLITICIDFEALDDANLYLDKLKQIKEKTSDPNIKLDYQISEGLIHKSNKRIIHLGKAMDIFENLAKQEIESLETKIFILLELAELLIMNYKLLPSSEILDQVNLVLSDIIGLSENNNTHPIIIETLLIKAKFSQVLSNFSEALIILEKALKIAESKNLNIYVEKIRSEFRNIEKFVEIWSKSNLDVKLKMDQIFLIDYLNSVSRIIK